METKLIERLAGFTPVQTEGNALWGILLALAVSTVAAALAQLLYVIFFEKRQTGSQIQRSFLLIGPSITLLFICVQISLPLSLGLLGALSIVRFRVPIKEPEEVGFLMVVVASSIACATYSYVLLAALFVVVVVALLLREPLAARLGRAGRMGGLLLITLPDEAHQAHDRALEPLLEGCLGRVRLESVTSRDGVTNLSYAFRGRPGIAWAEVKREIAETCRATAVSVLFSRPGGIQ
jgi:hypothetical protein